MPTHYQGTPAEVRALDTYIKLIRASDTIGSQIRDLIASFDLTEAQLNELVVNMVEIARQQPRR